MLTVEELKAALERFISNTASENDRLDLQQALQSGKITLARSEGGIAAAHGQSNVVVGGGAEGAFLITGGEFTMQVVVDAAVYDRFLERLLPASQESEERPLDWRRRFLGAAPFVTLALAAIAISLISDVARRFLGDDGDWPDIAGTIAQPVLVTLAALAAALTGTALFLPFHPLVGKGAWLGILRTGFNSKRALIITGITVAIAVGIRLSLPFFARVFNERGVQYHEQGDLSSARESYERAVRLRTSYAPAHYNLATAYEDSRPERAIEEYLLAIKYDSRIYPAYNNLARLYLIRGKDNDRERALGILAQARDSTPADESPQTDNAQYSLYKNLGWANYSLKNYLQAEKDLGRAIALQPDRAAAHCLMAYVLIQLGKAGVSAECYDCVSLSADEKDVEEKWLSDAKECLMKGKNK